MKKHNPTNLHQPQELSWRRLVLRKWLNISASNSDYSADTPSNSDSDSDQEFCDWPKCDSRLKNNNQDGVQIDSSVPEALPRLRRRKSETFRAQYINRKEIRICAGTWNVGGVVPSNDMDLDDWLDTDNPADIYVIGLQEIIPLNAGNVLGAEDNRPVLKWENIIRETLNRVLPVHKFKSYSNPVSPSKFKPSEDALDIEDETVLESDSDAEDGICPLNEDLDSLYECRDGVVEDQNIFSAHISNFVGKENTGNSVGQEPQYHDCSPKNLDRLNCLKAVDSDEITEGQFIQSRSKLTKTLSGTERIGLSWPEPALHLLPRYANEKPSFVNTSKSFKDGKVFRTYSSFKSNAITENGMRSALASLAELNLESLINRKRRPPFVRIMSKQMVGIFITIWVRRSLRRHIQNLNVSTVGVGVMGYIGNKGSISVSMSVYQTLFCFVCTHLTAGEKDTDVAKRNADVHEIHKRTQFTPVSSMGLPKRIYDHERIIWLGDLNYRINLSYQKTRELVSKKEWSKLVEQDQLVKELRKGCAFDGWSEGTLTFAPTYKYEFNSDSYCGRDSSKPGRRTPAWCDRILSFGTGMKLLSYKRCEIKLSDHRPVTSTYLVDVEVFSPRKLQRALTFTDAEVEEEGIIIGMGLNSGMGDPTTAEDESYWEQQTLGSGTRGTVGRWVHR